MLAPPPSRALVTASYLLIAGALLLIMWQGLLPGLLCVCIGFLGTRWFARLLRRGPAPLLPQGRAATPPARHRPGRASSPRRWCRWRRSAC